MTHMYQLLFTRLLPALMCALALGLNAQNKARCKYDDLLPSLKYVDVNSDSIISLEEAKIVFDQYYSNHGKELKGDLLDDVESTLIELISHLEGVSCQDIKRSVASKRFIEVYYTNKFYNALRDTFGIPSTNTLYQSNNPGNETNNFLDKYFSVAGQITNLYQVPFGFKKPDAEGNNSFDWKSENLGLFTVPIDFTPWKGATFNISPEYSGGNGVGNGVGLGSYPNAMYGFPQPTPYLLRAQYHQSIEIDTTTSTPGIKSMELLFGRFVIQEAFNVCEYSFDPTNDFLNLSHTMMSAWDAATTAYGYTHGGALRFNLKRSMVNLAFVTVNKVPAGIETDWKVGRGHSLNAQYAYKYNLLGRSGNIRLLTFLNRAYSGSFSKYVTDSITGESFFPDSLKTYQIKTGFGLDADLMLNDNICLFTKYSFNNGQTETTGYTQADRSLCFGLTYTPNRFNRPNDLFGFALSRNGLSKEHSQFLADGGTGFMIGDGSLSYQPENALEIFYKINFIKYADLTFNYQYIKNSAYNTDRGNVHFFGTRLNFEF